MSELEPAGWVDGAAPIDDIVPLQAELDERIDAVLEVLERADAAGVELDPMAAILRRLEASGVELPPMVQMLIAGMG